MQKSRVKVNDQGRKITLRELEHRCQLVVRLKVNKCYQELLCSLSSYINPLNLLNLQGLRNQLQAPGRFQISSPWSRSLTNSDLKGVLVLVLVFVQSLGQLAAIPPLLDKLLALSQSGRSRMSCLSSVARLVGLNRSIVGLIGWCFQYCSCNHSPEQFKTESFPWIITHPHQTFTRITYAYREII